MDSYKIRNSSIYFLTFTVINWIDVFTRQLYRDIMLDNVGYYRQQRGLMLHAYVIMSNHAHFLMSNDKEPLSDTVRDYKKITATKILSAIQTQNESRKEWMLNDFAFTGRKNSRNANYQFWIHNNHPEECFSNEFLQQKLDYIHNNPVRAGLVSEPHHYLYSSAASYAGIDGLIEIDYV